MRSRVSAARRIAILSSLCAGVVWSQATNSADVTGSVTDTSGAVVPGVTVTVHDVDKNTDRVINTNASGVYDTGPIVADDHYVIDYKKEGFATARRGPMNLASGSIGINVELTVGSSAQTIVVEDTVGPLLETSTSEIAQTIPQETLAVLPQTGGTPDWQSFLALLPGTRGNGGDNNNPGMGGVSVNGSMPFSNALLDGASTSSPMSNNVINTPIFDTVAEVKMSDSLFSAQYGTGGVLYNQISKGGTNKVHGTGFEYFKNTALNAAPFGFNGTAGVRAPTHFDDFGGDIGGPVIRNKIFAFFALENVVNHGSPPISFISVPTDAMRAGNFAGMAPIYNPLTQVVDPATGVVTRQPFTNNQIDPSLFDKVAQNIQTYFPRSNRTGNVVNGVTTNNYSYQVPSISPKRKYFGRFDADLTKNNRLSGSATWNDGPTVGVGPVCPLNCTNSDIFNTNNQLSDYWTISANTINEARIGFMGEYDLITPDTLGKGFAGKLGLQYAKADNFPAISISSIYGLGPGSPSLANYKENNIDISDQVTLIRGRHILHFGGEVLIFRADSTAWGAINSANLGFTGVYTAGSNQGALASTSGVAYADFLLGYAKSWSASVSPEYGGRLKNPGAFIQDDFKLTPKFTLNLGLRWEGNTGWSDIHGNERSFDPNVLNPATNTLGAMWYGTTQANGRASLQKPVWENWLPRVGFAYLYGDKTTIRGGIGLYTYPWNVDTYASAGLGNAFTASGNETDSTNNVQPVVILGSDGNTNYQGAKGASINSLFKRAPSTPDAYNGQAVGFNQYTSPVPLLKSWNLTIQRQVTKSMVADFGYIGSVGSHLAFTKDVNQVPENLLAPNDAASRPYPEFQSLTGYTTEGISNYNAFQTGLTRRSSRGLMFNVNYTWSHMMDNQDSSGWGSQQGATPYQRAYNPMANYGPSNFDVRQMFKGNAAYQLPFGRGRKWINNSAFLDEVIGGWQLFGSFVSQSGSPFTPTMQTNNSYSLSSNAAWFPNLVGDPTAVPGGQSINSWFSAAALASPTPGTFGNLGRNSLLGPRLNSVNMSLHKTFTLRESLKLDFSASASNVINHPSFAQPDKTIGPGHFGQITGTSVGARQMELIAKLYF